jgi:DNA-binding transcriptional LysR family regulator
MQSLRRSLPLLNALVAFESATRHRSLTRAAEEIGISQSAVSRHVANLEAQTGLALFRRRHKAVEPSEAGLRLAAAIASGFGHVRAVLEELQQARPDRPLTIACSYDVASLWVLPRLPALRARLGGREIRLVTSDSYIDFGSADIDLSLRFGRGHWPGFKATCLLRECAAPVAAPALLRGAGRRSALSAAEIAALPLLHLSNPGTTGLDWARWARHHGVKLPAGGSAGRFTSYTILLQAAAEGRGVALGWRGFVDASVQRGALVEVADLAVATRRGLYLVHRGDIDPGDVAEAIGALGETDAQE